MRISYISAGAAGMYCGTCMHDNTLAAALIDRGHEVSLVPTYTPPRTDERSVATERIFFGAINVYLQQKLAFFRHTPWLVDRLLDSPRLLGWVSRLGTSTTDAAMLGSMTLSMLQGEKGLQKKELEKLVRFLEDVVEPEVVHLSFTLFLGFARRIRERLGVPVVCSLQGEDLFFDELREPYLTPVLAEVRERAQEIDAFTAPCRDYAERMSHDYGIPADKIHLAKLGIATDGFRPKAQPAAGTEDDPLILGFFARECPEKGLHLLLEAFRLLNEDPAMKQSLRLRIAGYLGGRDREYVAEQHQRLAAWGLEDKVEWVGEVDREGKYDFLSSLDLFSVPAVYREPKGIYVLEALASGVPVVQPRHGGFPEMIEATGGGILVDPCSADALAAGLRSLAEDRDRRLRLGREGRRATLERYSADAMAEETLDVYRRLVGDKRQAA